MTSQLTIDSHVHLIPHSAANRASHTWLHAGHPLQRQWSVSDYVATLVPGLTQAHADFKGFVYVETDRALGLANSADFQRWDGPLEEISFLRRIVEGNAHENEGNLAEHADMLLGIVLWAPVNQGSHTLEQYLDRAEDIAGPNTWQRVKGFRFLVQAITDEQEFTDLVLGEAFVEWLRLLARRGYAFDVGVDQRQGGVWQLEIFLACITRVREGYTSEEYGTFVLNHLCKPDMKQFPETIEQTAQFTRWKACMERFGNLDNVYMKLSGGFSELPQQREEEPWSSDRLLGAMDPWLDHIYKSFASSKLMFGSDWPVCTIGGPGIAQSWALWRSVVAQWMERCDFSQTSKDDVWFGTAARAYRLGPFL